MLKNKTFSAVHYFVLAAVTLGVFLICVCVGSVFISPSDTLKAVLSAVTGIGVNGNGNSAVNSIIVYVRLPRVICVALEGAALSLCGAAMQGLLKNPLADGSTIGVSSGASLGAIIAIAFSGSIPFLANAGTIVMAMLFAFGSLVLILTLTYKLDYSLATNTIILIGVIFSMFVSSIISFIVAFAGDKAKTIVFWTMGSLAGVNYDNVLTLLIFLMIFGTILCMKSRELDAFAMGEENARHVGINVKSVKQIVLISIAALIGVNVSIGGTIGFVGLVIPRMVRLVVGPNHGKLLPVSIFTGASFLMLADLLSRTIANPLELPIGAVTSFVGSVLFIYIFYISRTRKDG